jgi:hypothetical protein
MDPKLRIRQAYLVMFEFLRRHYERGPTDEIGGLLGGRSLLPDGQPAGSAMTEDFESAAAVVLSAEAAPGGYREAGLRLGSGGSA